MKKDDNKKRECLCDTCSVKTCGKPKTEGYAGMMWICDDYKYDVSKEGRIGGVKHANRNQITMGRQSAVQG